MKRICDWKLNGFEKGLIREKTLDSISTAGKKRNKTLVEMNRLVRNRKEWKSFTERNPTP